MGKVSGCLKRSYIIVASLIAAISALLLALTLFSHGYFHDDEEIEKVLTGLHSMYIISIITLLLAITGVYGASKKKQWALIVFAVGMILGSLFMVVCEIHGLAMRPQAADELTRQYLQMLPLANASEAFLISLEAVQFDLQCCGLEQGYVEWGHNISESCLCVEETINPCVAAPRNSSLFENMWGDQPVMIYKEACLPFLIVDAMTTINILLGVILGVTLLWMLSVALCVVILCRMRRKEDLPAVVYSSEAKSGNYTTLTDAAEYT